MRPLRLELQAFGSYPGREVVDFEALANRGLFVVTGPTGTGKSTVFDALVFALYGVLPGGRSSDGEARSHFAAPLDETYAQLTFEVDGKRYTARRTPRQARPKARGTGTTDVVAGATVVRHDAGGDTELATKATEATAQIESLLGITAKQFQRVVLLPQGKFTDFLIAGDEDREQLLRHLFGGELYEKATLILKDRMKKLADEYAGVQQRVGVHRDAAIEQLSNVVRLWRDDDHPGVDPQTSDDDLRSLIDELDAERPQRERERDELGTAATAATEARTKAQEMAQRVEDAATHQRDIEALEAQRQQMEDAAARARASQAARPVVDADDARAVADDSLQLATQRHEDARTLLRDGFRALGIDVLELDPARVAAAVQAATADVDAQRQKLQEKAAADSKVAHTEQQFSAATAGYRSAVATYDTAEQTIAELDAEVRELTPVAARVGVLELDHRAAEQRRTTHSTLVSARDELGRAIEAEGAARHDFEDVMRRFLAAQAPLLAATLQAGDACPVCGSVEHPAPARHLADEMVDHTQVDAAQRQLNAAGQKMSAAAQTVEGLREQLGADADAPPEHFEAKVGQVWAELSGARRAADRLREVEALHEQATARRDQARTDRDDAKSTVDKLDVELQAARADAQRRAAEVVDVDAEALDDRAATLAELGPTAESLTELLREREAAGGALTMADNVLSRALAESTYPDIAAARAALLPPSDEGELIAAHQDWESKLTTARTGLDLLRRQGIPDEPPDVALLQTLEEEARGAHAEVSRRFTTATNSLTTAAAELQKADDVAAESIELKRRYDTARAVFRTCNGEAGIRVKLERWVLAGELDRVTQAANVHLARMTGHRYSLQRDTASRGGLGLLVSDSHNGRTRATASLSGGEQFQASLALALGLADVVSHGGSGSGRTFEALFIDEGFGSLDQQALDEAIAALMQLHATGRMVGAITHVEAMKQSLHVGIEVQRLGENGGSTLKVRP